MPLVPDVPKFDPVHDILHYESQALDAIFAPKNVAVIGATENAGQRRPHRPVEPDQQPVRRHGLPGQPQAAQRAGHQGLSQHRRRAGAGRPGGDRHAGRRPCPASSANASTPACKARSSSRPASRRPARQGVELERQILEHARRGNMRIIGPNCLGVMSPHQRPQRHLRQRHGAAGQRRLHQPERRALHRRARLEPAGERRLQRLRLHRLDARRRLGRPDLLPGR